MKYKIRVVHEVTVDLPLNVDPPTIHGAPALEGMLVAKFSGLSLREQAPFPRELMEHGLRMAVKEAYAAALAYARNSIVVGDVQLVTAGMVCFSGDTFSFEALPALS